MYISMAVRWQTLLNTAGLGNVDDFAAQVTHVVDTCRMQAEELQLAEKTHPIAL